MGVRPASRTRFAPPGARQPPPVEIDIELPGLADDFGETGGFGFRTGSVLDAEEQIALDRLACPFIRNRDFGHGLDLFLCDLDRLAVMGIAVEECSQLLGASCRVAGLKALERLNDAGTKAIDNRRDQQRESQTEKIGQRHRLYIGAKYSG